VHRRRCNCAIIALSQHVDATFILVVVEVAVDVVVILQAVLDVTAAAAAAVSVRVLGAVTTRHHQTAVHVGVIQLTRLAVNQSCVRVVVASYPGQRRAERRP